jgi:hypothetical protein
VDGRDKPGHDAALGVAPMTADDFRKLALRNPANDALLGELMRFELPEAWIVSGCLAQTIWNQKTGRDRLRH